MASDRKILCTYESGINEQQYYEDVSNLFSKNVMSEQLRKKFFCSYCLYPAKRIESNVFPEFPSSVILTCSGCVSCWSLCRVCQACDQPSTLPLSDFKRKKKQIPIFLREQLHKHEVVYHTADNGELHFDTKDVLGSDDENSIVIRDEKDRSQSVTKELLKAFPNTSVELLRNKRIREILIQKECYDSYAEFLIRERWIQCEVKNVVISKSDCDLFLRIVYQLLINSRNEAADNVDIYRRIEQRNNLQLSLANKRILLLEKELASKNEELNKLHLKLSNEVTVLDEKISGTNLSERYTLPLPICMSEARTKIIEGKKSFLNGLVIPKIRTLNCGYAYTLPSDVIPLSIALGMDFELITKHTDKSKLHARSMYRSKFISKAIFFPCNDCDSNRKDMVDEIYTIALGIWSDGYDAGGASKNNRSLVKLTTIHVVHPSLSQEHVFPIGLGKNDSNHNEIREILLKDMDFLCNNLHQCYVPKLKKTITVKFMLAYVIQDRVEHSDWTGFMSHSGTYSSIPGFSCPVNTFYEKNNDLADQVSKCLASCDDCKQSRLDDYAKANFCKAADSSQICPNCYDWDLSLVKFQVDDDYPKDAPDNNGVNGYLCAKEITFNTMRAACELIFKKNYEKKWTRKVAKKFASHECIKDNTFKGIYDSARLLRDAPNDDLPSPSLEEKILPPGMRQNLIPLNQCIVGIMHTMIMNIGRHLILTMVPLLRDSRQWNDFKVSSNDLFQKVRTLSLSWCKAWPFGTTTDKPASAWVSENYLAFCIISKCLCSNLSLEQSCSILIKRTIWSYNSLISQIMQPTVPDDEDCIRVTAMSKIFLSCFNDMDREIKNRETSKIETTACLVNALFIGDEMRERGIQRNFWEGDLLGEGYIYVIKPLMKRGIQQNGILASVLEKIYRIRLLKGMMEYNDLLELDKNTTDGNDSNMSSENSMFTTSRYRRFRCYRKIDDVVHAMNNHDPIAMMFHRYSKIFYVMIWKRIRVLVQAQLKEIRFIFGTQCFEIEFDLENQKTKIDEISNIASDYTSILLLPMYTVDNDAKLFYVHTENHEELGKNGCFCLPPSYMENENNILDTQPPIEENTEMLSRDHCQTFVGQEVKQLENRYPGFVTAFKFKMNNIMNENAEWTVKYYKDEINVGNAYKTIKCNYDNLQLILL